MEAQEQELAGFGDEDEPSDPECEEEASQEPAARPSRAPETEDSYPSARTDSTGLSSLAPSFNRGDFDVVNEPASRGDEDRREVDLNFAGGQGGNDDILVADDECEEVEAEVYAPAETDG